MAKTLKNFARIQASEEKNDQDQTPKKEGADGSETETQTEGEAEPDGETQTEGESTEGADGSETETQTEGEADGADGSEGETQTEGESTEGKTKPKAEVKTGAKSAGLKPGQIAIDASELDGLRSKAALWEKHEKELTTLQTWYANTTQISGMAKEDTTNRADAGAASSVANQPWNQNAKAIAEKYHS